jgi:hypothetical protein
MSKQQIINKVKKESGILISLDKADGVWYFFIEGVDFGDIDHCLHACQLRDINVNSLLSDVQELKDGA